MNEKMEKKAKWYCLFNVSLSHYFNSFPIKKDGSNKLSPCLIRCKDMDTSFLGQSLDMSLLRSFVRGVLGGLVFQLWGSIWCAVMKFLLGTKADYFSFCTV